jgi:arylsulfatase A-like enzyme
MSRSRPTVVMITAHDIGRHLGCYGIHEVDTPHIDGLAGTGVRFTNFYSTSPQCSPSRASFATGRYPHSTGVLGICNRSFGFDLNCDETHLAGLLKTAGYGTHGIGEVHETLVPQRLFDNYSSEIHPDRIVDETRAILRESRSDARPLYLQIGFRHAHRPFENGSDTSNGVFVPPWLETEQSAVEELSRFQGSIKALDNAVGDILEDIQVSGDPDNTCVLFLGDHGIPFPRAKHSLYEPGCTIAAILRWPANGWRGGSVVDVLASGVDILPTLMNALDLPIPENVQGHDLGESIMGAPTNRRSLVFTEQNFHAYLDCSRAVRDERYKIIANFSPGKGYYDPSQSWRPSTKVKLGSDRMAPYHPPLELYDLNIDPLERRNLSDSREYESVKKRLSTELLTWMNETGDPILNGIPNPPIYRRAFEELGVSYERGAR